jgi:hypothetical protein
MVTRRPISFEPMLCESGNAEGRDWRYELAPLNSSSNPPRISRPVVFVCNHFSSHIDATIARPECMLVGYDWRYLAVLFDPVLPPNTGSAPEGLSCGVKLRFDCRDHIVQIGQLGVVSCGAAGAAVANLVAVPGTDTHSLA